MNRRGPRFALACAAGLLTAPLAHADRAEVCYDGGQAAPPDNSRVFNCPTLGALTLPQIGQLGWRIVKLRPVVDGSVSRNQLLVRFDERIFRAGFE